MITLSLSTMQTDKQFDQAVYVFTNKQKIICTSRDNLGLTI